MTVRPTNNHDIRIIEDRGRVANAAGTDRQANPYDAAVDCVRAKAWNWGWLRGMNNQPNGFETAIKYAATADPLFESIGLSASLAIVRELRP